jgi:DNA-binding GntR family transcriptional regulator
VRSLGGRASLVEQASASVRAAILSGEMIAGRLYSVNDVAGQLGVSRTPVREAVLGLADAGLVRVERNRGFRVVRPDAGYLRNVMDLRLLLEVPATRQAAESASTDLADELDNELRDMRRAAKDGDEPELVVHDRAFHEAILTAAGNPLLTATVRGLRDSISSVGASTAGRSRSLRAIADEHRPLAIAIRASDGIAAAAAMRHHLSHTRDLLITQVSGGNPSSRTGSRP